MKKVALKILFGKKVRELRVVRKKTQEQMAFELGTSLRQYGRIERGEVNTGMDTISRLASILKVKPKDLFDFD